MLATAEYGPEDNLKVSDPILIPMIEGCNGMSSAVVTSFLYHNIPLFAKRFANTRDYLNKMTNIPITSIPTINYFMHSN